MSIRLHYSLSLFPIPYSLFSILLSLSHFPKFIRSPLLVPIPHSFPLSMFSLADFYSILCDIHARRAESYPTNGLSFLATETAYSCLLEDCKRRFSFNKHLSILAIKNYCIGASTLYRHLSSRMRKLSFFIYDPHCFPR